MLKSIPYLLLLGVFITLGVYYSEAVIKLFSPLLLAMLNLL